MKESESRRNRSYEPGRHPPRHHDERGTADHVRAHLRNRQQAAEALSLLPYRRGYSRHRGPHGYLHSGKRARQQRLAGRLLGFRIARQHHPVPARRAAHLPVHQELRWPRDERATQVAWCPAKRRAKDGVHDRVAAALGVPFRPRHSSDRRNKPRAAKRIPSWSRTFRRGNHPHSGTTDAVLPAVSQARRAGHAEGTRLDEHQQLAGEHHSLHRLHLADPLLTSEPKGALQWHCTRRSMARGSTHSISRSARSSPPTARARPSPSTACPTNRWRPRWPTRSSTTSSCSTGTPA